MPIKRTNPIQKQDFEEALDYLGSSVSEIAKGANIPRAYLSELKNRNVRLRREHEDKLRSFLEDAGIEFEAADPPSQVPEKDLTPHPSLEAAAIPQYFIPITRDLDDNIIEQALDVVAEMDEDIGGLLRAPAERGILDPYSDAFDKLLAKAQRVMAAHYLVFRVLRGLPGDVTIPEGRPKTLKDALVLELRAELERAGMIAKSDEPAAPSERQSAEAVAA